MVVQVPEVRVGDPASFSEGELDDFTAFVLAGGEVAAQGLRERVAQAAYIAFAREDDCLLGVAGLKRPHQSYRRRIETSAKVRLPASTLTFELGWVFVLPSARGRKLSVALCRPLLAQAEGRGIFATSHTERKRMHSTLKKLGFIRVGQEWISSENDGTLAMFIRNAV